MWRSKGNLQETILSSYGSQRLNKGYQKWYQVPLPAGNLDNPSSLIYCFIRTSGIGTISQKWNCDQWCWKLLVCNWLMPWCYIVQHRMALAYLNFQFQKGACHHYFLTSFFDSFIHIYSEFGSFSCPLPFSYSAFLSLTEILLLPNTSPPTPMCILCVVTHWVC